MAEEPRDPQEAAIALELYQRQIETVTRQVDFLQQAHDEVDRARRTLEGLSEAQGGDVLLPLGASTFVRGRVADADRVIVGIGAGYATERERAAAITRLEERAKEIGQELDRTVQAVVQLQNDYARLQESLEREADEG